MIVLTIYHEGTDMGGFDHVDIFMKDMRTGIPEETTYRCNTNGTRLDLDDIVTSEICKLVE